MENAGILCVFQVFQTAVLEQKIRRRPQTHLRCAAHKEKSRPAAATVGRRAAFRKTRTATVFSLTESSAYELLHEDGFPSLRIGSRLVVAKEQFRLWVERQTGGAHEE